MDSNTDQTKLALLEQNIYLMNEKLDSLDRGMEEIQKKLDKSVLASNVAISRLTTLQEVHAGQIKENSDSLKNAWRAVGAVFLTFVGAIAQALVSK